MENQELNQTGIYSQIVETNEVSKPEKGCKTCGKSGFNKKNANLIILGSSIIFFTFYGLQAFVKDVFSFFTR